MRTRDMGWMGSPILAAGWYWTGNLGGRMERGKPSILNVLVMM